MTMARADGASAGRANLSTTRTPRATHGTDSMTDTPEQTSGDESADEIVVLVGNPSPGSRTLEAAVLVATRIAALTDVADQPAVVDLAHHKEQLLGWQSPATESLKHQITSARAIVVASPTYKASYTGLLKLFLDQFARDEWHGIPTIALMTGGSPAHSLAVEVHLAPVLVEIGASLPTRGLYLAGAEIDDPEPTIDAWWHNAEAPLRRALSA